MMKIMRRMCALRIPAPSRFPLAYSHFPVNGGSSGCFDLRIAKSLKISLE